MRDNGAFVKRCCHLDRRPLPGRELAEERVNVGSVRYHNLALGQQPALLGVWERPDVEDVVSWGRCQHPPWGDLRLLTAPLVYCELPPFDAVFG